MRTIGWRAKPSARMQPPERSSPISAAVSREERKPVSTPSRTIGTRRPSTPSSSQRKLPRPPGDGGVGGDVHALGAEAERADAVGRHEARAGVRGLAARARGRAPPRGPPTRAPGARAARRRASGSCARAGRPARCSSAHRLGGHARRVPGQLQLEEVLVAGLRHVAAVRGRVGADLALAAVDRHRRRCRRRTRSRAARRARPRWWRTACRSGTPRSARASALTPGSVRSPASAASEHGQLLLERHLERVALEAGSTTRRGRAAPAASGAASGTAGCASATASARASAASASARSVPRTAAKPHAPPHAHADADPLALTRVELVETRRCGSRGVRPWNARSARRHSRRALALNPSTP